MESVVIPQVHAHKLTFKKGSRCSCVQIMLATVFITWSTGNGAGTANIEIARLEESPWRVNWSRGSPHHIIPSYQPISQQTAKPVWSSGTILSSGFFQRENPTSPYMTKKGGSLFGSGPRFEPGCGPSFFPSSVQNLPIGWENPFCFIAKNIRQIDRSFLLSVLGHRL